MAEYYSPRAKKRWCLSLYDNVGVHSLGVFPQAAMVSYLFISLIYTNESNISHHMSPYGIHQLIPGLT